MRVVSGRISAKRLYGHFWGSQTVAFVETPIRCRVVQPTESGSIMPTKPRTKKMKPAVVTSAPRASITFSREVYKTLEELARRKKVSIAWVVRDAAERYIADQWPLLEQKPERSPHGH